MAARVWGADDGIQVEQVSAQPVGQAVERLERTIEEQQLKIEVLRHRLTAHPAGGPQEDGVEQVKRLVRELMSDGAFRNSLYPDVAQVGYDEGFYIKRSDEVFLLKISGMMQVRWTGTQRRTDNLRVYGRTRQDDTGGFEVQYLELNFDGQIHGPKLLYHISLIGDTDRENAWQTYYAQILYECSEELVLSAGILDLPQGFNNLVADHKQLFVDRAMAEEVFNVGYTPGVALSGLLFGRLEYAVGVFNGIGNTTDGPSREELDTNFAYAASLIYHLLGDGVGDDETDLPFRRDPLWDVGGSFAYHDDNGDLSGSGFYSIPDRVRRGRGIGGYAEADLTGTELLQFGAHTAFRWRGFSLTAEWYLRVIDGEGAHSPWELLTDRSDPVHFQGGYIEAGYFVLPKKLELAARLGGIWDAGGDGTWEYTFGVNYYPFGSHNFKIQADFTRIDEVPLDSTNGNWFQNDETILFRVALQAVF